MGFGDLKTDSGLQSLNDYLKDKSYIEGYVSNISYYYYIEGYVSNILYYYYNLLYRYVPSQGDVAIFNAVGSPPSSNYINVLRWYNHIASYSDNEKLA